MSSKEETYAGEKITPKKKSPVKALFLLSVPADKFPPVSTCHSPKANNGLYTEVCEPLMQEFSHKKGEVKK